MALPKLFQRIFWHNNTTPAINEDNLNAMSKAIDDIDNRVIVLGDDVITVIPQIQAYLAQAEDLVEAMELLSQNPPYIGANGNWYVWDTNTSAFVDSGVDASITVNIADITMLAPDATPYVTNSGTATDPIFHLFIPRGQTGNGISTIAKTGTSGLVDTYTITMTDGTTSTFTVTNGSGDMNKSVYDPTNAIANAGGMKSAAAKNSTNAVTENSTDLVESGAVYSADKGIYEVMGQNGAKNHIFVNLKDAKEVNTTTQPNKGSWSGNTWTFVGLSHAVNDGEITISGTQTGSPVSFYFSDSSTWGLVNGETYVISANASGELNANHHYEQLILTKDDTQVAEVDVADETITFTYDSSSVYKLGSINRAANVSHNYAIKPMICPKSWYDTDPTYQPYAMTNRELTEDVTITNISTTWHGAFPTGISLTYSFVFKQGKHIFGDIVVKDENATPFAKGSISIPLTNAPATGTPSFGVYCDNPTNDMTVAGIGYAYVGKNTVALLLGDDNTSAHQQYFKMHLDYVTA